tara:strand:+ start:30 stop:203 length:174 start_codon:yes stop_codon:yes gene_type:complete
MLETDKLIRSTRISIQIALENQKEALKKLEIAEEELQQKRNIVEERLEILHELIEGE